MLKNKNLWLKVAALLVFSFQSSAVFAEPALKAAAEIPALSELLAAVPANLVELPAAPEVKAAPQPGPAPQPGKEFTPVVYDQQRIEAMMKLLGDIYGNKPLPYDQDGTTFKNKEGKLPAQPAGYYKEYTLLTGNAPHTVKIGDKTYKVAPDLSARGSERVIIGGGEHVYYTPDHYANFILLKVVR
jgi:ribonuclease T1